MDTDITRKKQLTINQHTYTDSREKVLAITIYSPDKRVKRPEDVIYIDDDVVDDVIVKIQTARKNGPVSWDLTDSRR